MQDTDKKRRDLFAAPYGLEPLFQRKIKNIWLRRLAALVLVMAVMTATGLVAAKAFGSTACDVNSCGTPPDYATSQYTKGNMGRDHFAWDQFKNPKEAHQLALDRIKAKISAADTLAKSSTATADDVAASKLASSKTAQEWLNTITSADDDCVGQGGYAPYSTGFSVCDYTHHSGNTKEGIQRIGVVSFCAGSVFITFVTGGGAALVAFGSAQCLWTAYLAFSP